MKKKTLRLAIAVFISNFFIFLTPLLLSVHAAGPEASSIDDMNVNTGEYEWLLKGIPMSIAPEMLEKAKQAIPGDINERVERERFKLIERDFQNTEAAGDISGNINQEQAENALHVTSILKEDERIYVFISSSVPKETLRNYARDLDALGEPQISIVMRGFVGGMTKIRPTLEFLKGVLFKDENCESDKCDAYQAPVLIDPLLFRRYEIEAMPAIVYARGVRGMAAVSDGVEEGEDGDYYLLYGDSALDGAMELLNREAGSRSLDCLIWKIRINSYYGINCK